MDALSLKSLCGYPSYCTECASYLLCFCVCVLFQELIISLGDNKLFVSISVICMPKNHSTSSYQVSIHPLMYSSSLYFSSPLSVRIVL